MTCTLIIPVCRHHTRLNNLESVSNCITCPGFNFCQDRTKLGTFVVSQPVASLEIKYESDEEPAPNALQIQLRRRANRIQQKDAESIAIPEPQTIEGRPLETWDDANPLKLPLYRSRSNNIFLKMQSQQLLGGGSDDAEMENVDSPTTHLYLALPSPDDVPTDDNMAYFLSSRMDTFLGFQDCFSSAYKSMYLSSSNNRVLRHILFAFVKYLNPGDRALLASQCNMHLSRAIPQLQHALTFRNFDEAHILAVPLLAYLAFWWQKPDVAKGHLKGFYKMLLHARYLEQDRQGKVSVSPGMPSLMLLMWRVAVRLDRYFGFMRPDVETLPPINSMPGSSRRYITDFIDTNATEWTEWLTIMDDLEDLRNLAGYYNRRTATVRHSNKYTPTKAQQYINQAGEKIIQKLSRSDASIIGAAAVHKAAFQPLFEPVASFTLETFPVKQFLPSPLILSTWHHRFIEATITNRATLIHVTITSHPKAGPYPPERLQAAVEICSAVAILKDRMPFALQGRGSFLEALLFAGYTFCSPEFALGTIVPISG